MPHFRKEAKPRQTAAKMVMTHFRIISVIFTGRAAAMQHDCICVLHGRTRIALYQCDTKITIVYNIFLDRIIYIVALLKS